jgi:hypothetical protein
MAMPATPLPSSSKRLPALQPLRSRVDPPCCCRRTSDLSFPAVTRRRGRKGIHRPSADEYMYYFRTPKGCELGQARGQELLVQPGATRQPTQRTPHPALSGWRRRQQGRGSARLRRRRWQLVPGRLRRRWPAGIAHKVNSAGLCRRGAGLDPRKPCRLDCLPAGASHSTPTQSVSAALRSLRNTANRKGDNAQGRFSDRM